MTKKTRRFPKTKDIPDFKDLEFLALKSKELLEKQINSYRHKRSDAGRIIGISALFIPFFINGIENSHIYIKYISILPISLLIISIVILLTILFGRSLDQNFSVDKFKELVNLKYDEILLFEIGANKDSFKDNKIKTEKTNRIYNICLVLTIAGVFISVILLVTNKFVTTDSPQIKVEIVESSISIKSILNRQNKNIFQSINIPQYVTKITKTTSDTSSTAIR